MTLILSLETSTDVCSVALHQDGILLKENVLQQSQAHAAMLSPLIQELFQSTSLPMDRLNAVCVSSGPGSYTGLRIGTSTAKGLCYALNLPLIAVPTLDLLAFQASIMKTDSGLLCPIMDARRMEVYCKVFGHDLSVKREVEARVIDENSFGELLETNRMLFVGNGVQKCEGVIRHNNAVFLKGISPLASSLGVLAFRKFKRMDVEDLMLFKPFYLKDFIAKKAQPLLD